MDKPDVFLSDYFIGPKYDLLVIMYIGLTLFFTANKVIQDREAVNWIHLIYLTLKEYLKIHIIILPIFIVLLYTFSLA